MVVEDGLEEEAWHVDARQGGVEGAEYEELPDRPAIVSGRGLRMLGKVFSTLMRGWCAVVVGGLWDETTVGMSAGG